MQQQRFLKARLTIQEFTLPGRHREPNTQGKNTAKRSSLIFLNSNNDRKSTFYNPEQRETRRNEPPRMSEPEFRQGDQFVNNLINLPEIREKAKTTSADKDKGEERLQSYSSAKLIRRSYHRVERSIAERQKLAALKSNKIDAPGPKIFTINQLQSQELNKSPQPLSLSSRLSKDKLARKTFHFNTIQKNHLNRFKKEMIPEQLMTQRCPNKQVDHENIQLQLKNIVRFKFDSNMDLAKDKKNKRGGIRDSLGIIDGWGAQGEHLHSSRFYI